MNGRSLYSSVLAYVDLPFALAAAPLIYGFISEVPFYPKSVVMAAFAILIVSSLKRGVLALRIATLLSSFSVFYQFGGLGFFYLLAMGLALAGVASYKLEALILLDAVYFSLTPFFFLAPALVIFGEYEFGKNSGRNQGLVASLMCLGLGALLGNPMRSLFPSITADLPVLEASKPPIRTFTPKILLDAIALGLKTGIDPKTSEQINLALSRIFLEDLKPYLIILIWSLMGYISGYLSEKREGISRPFLSSLGGSLALLSLVFLDKSYLNLFLIILPISIGLTSIKYSLVLLKRKEAVEKAEISLKKRPAGIREILEAKKITLKEMDPEKLFKGVADYGEVKQELTEAIIWPLIRSDLAREYGVEMAKGILLFGPPGCGKTLLMRTLAENTGLSFIHVKLGEILSKWYGESERNLLAIFERARAIKPCIIFLDELDSIGKRRDLYSSDDVTPRLLSLMLSEMDGMRSEGGIVVVGATNMPDLLDPALLRPGRFDKLIYVPPPDFRARVEILKAKCTNLPLAEDVNFEFLAKATERFSGADLSALCSEVSRMVAFETIKTGKKRKISQEDFLKVIGSMKPSISMQMLDSFQRFKLDYERSRIRREKEEKRITWSDISDLEEAKAKLLESIELPLKHPDLMEKYRLEPVKGILLFGPPGCGKTMLSKAAAEELDVSFIYLTGSDVLSEGITKALSKIKEAFYRAKENVPSIIFLDELDEIAPARGKSFPGIVGELLSNMDGIKEFKGVVVLAASNRPWEVDPALLRSGRFDYLIYIPPPNEKARKEIFWVHLGGIPTAELELDELAQLSEGYSGADIAAVCREAKLMAIREKIGKIGEGLVTMEHLKKALSKVNPSISKDLIAKYEQFTQSFK